MTAPHRHHRKGQEDPLRRLIDRDAVTKVVLRLFRATDEGDWRGVESCFAERVALDMRSVGAPRSETRTPEQIAAGWRDALAHLENVHHQVGNLEVTLNGDRAHVGCYGTAWHHLPNPSGRDVRVFVGTYAIDLERRDGRWRIDRFRFDLRFLDGNPDLEGSAAPGERTERASSAPAEAGAEVP